MTELAACHTSAQTVIADTDCFILEAIGKVVFSFCHCPNKYAYAFAGGESVDIIPHSDNFGVEAERDFPACRWEMVGNGILYNLEKLFLRVD